jgi:hypothetical protein
VTPPTSILAIWLKRLLRVRLTPAELAAWTSFANKWFHDAVNDAHDAHDAQEAVQKTVTTLVGREVAAAKSIAGKLEARMNTLLGLGITGEHTANASSVSAALSRIR